MPIDWETVPDADAVGEELIELMRELFPFPRSLTGDGVRDTLAVLARELPLEVVETPTGEPVFDWTVPREWTIRGGWIEGPDGSASSTSPTRRSTSSATARRSTRRSRLEELREHVFTHPTTPTSSRTGPRTGRSSGGSA